MKSNTVSRILGRAQHYTEMGPPAITGKQQGLLQIRPGNKNLTRIQNEPEEISISFQIVIDKLCSIFLKYWVIS